MSTSAFVDSASLHDAFGALHTRTLAESHHWLVQSLLKCSYLLLFNNVQIVPGPGFSGAGTTPGYEAALVTQLPALMTKPQAQADAAKQVRRWLSHGSRPLTGAWRRLQAEPNLDDWSDIRRRLFWGVHIQSRPGLFNVEESSVLASVLNVSERDLQQLHALTTDPKIVKRWARGRIDDHARLANDAYNLSSLIRGKHHEYYAKNAELHLIPHPHRRAVASNGGTATSFPTTRAEELFVKMLVGAALQEPTARRRVQAWINNVVLAKNAIANGAVALPETTTDVKAEVHAVSAARATRLVGAPKWQQELLTWATGANLGLWAGLAFGPWGFPASAIPAGYKYIRGRSVGEDLAVGVSTKRNFARLARTVPGRIDWAEPSRG